MNVKSKQNKSKLNVGLGLLVGVMSLANSATALAQSYYYKFNPESRLYLGGGFNPYKSDQGFLKCLEFTDDDVKPVTNSNGSAEETRVKMKSVTSYQDLMQNINFSVSANAKGMFFKAGGGFKMSSDRAFHSDSFTWIVSFKSNYGRYAITRYKLAKEFQNLSDTELVDRCGSQVVLEETRGVELHAVFTLHNVTEKTKNSLNQNLSGSLSGGVWGGKMSQSFNQLIDSSRGMGALSFELIAVGGPGVTALKDLLNAEATSEKTFVDYKKIPKILNDYVNRLSARDAIPTSFTTAPIHIVKSLKERRYDNFQSYKIESLYALLLETDSTKRRLEDLLYEQKYASLRKGLSADAIGGLKSALDQQTENLNSVMSIVEKCFLPEAKPEDCKIPLLNRTAIDWPVTDFSRCQAERDLARRLNLIPDDLMPMVESRNLVPIIESTSPGVSELVGFRSCEEFCRGVLD